MTMAHAEVVTAYFSVVADLRSTESDLRVVLHRDLEVIEHPNLVRPLGHRTDLDGAVHGFLAGKALLSAQAIVVHEVLVDGDRAAVRSTWTGTIARSVGSLRAGAELTAHTAGFLTLSGGQVLRHETYDSYLPLTAE